MGQDNQTTMSEKPTKSGSALHRKVATGRAEHQAREMSLPKALRLTVGKVADGLFGLAIASISLRIKDVVGEELGTAFLDDGLLVLLDGPMGRRAAAVLDGPLVGALVQQQTMGQVLDGGQADARRLTPTDAAMCAPFLDALLHGIEGLPDDPADEKLIKGYRFGARAEDVRQLQLALAAARYRIVHLALDIAAGSRQGQMTLCFPLLEDGDDVADPPEGADGEGAEPSGAASDKRRLSETVLALHADLIVSLAQVKLPLHRLSALTSGDVLELRGCDFEKVDILTREGRPLGGGALGQVDGIRAVQVAHETARHHTPKRRAADREDLDLPDVSGAGIGVAEPELPEQIVEDSAALPDHSEKLLPDLPSVIHERTQAQKPEDLPDMSDLPGIDDTEFAAAG